MYNRTFAGPASGFLHRMSGTEDNNWYISVTICYISDLKIFTYNQWMASDLVKNIASTRPHL